MPDPRTLTRSETPPEPLAPGSWLVGRWRLERVIGTGGMGTVFEARHRNGKRVAIKTLHPELAHQPELLQRFFREGHLANTVEHPGVVSVLDDGTSSGGVPYLVMEFLEGEDLDERITRLGHPLTLEDALSIGVAVLDVLEAAHERQIVHRDIKPNNVFLTGDGQVKILDFGIARLRDAKGYIATLSGVTVGTPTFMSREQAHGRHDLVDGQSDLWSLGATLSYALTGDFLFDAESTVGFLAQLMTQEPRPLHSVAPHLPRPVAEVIDRSLHHDKQRRWKTAREMKAALLEAAAACGVIIPERPSLAGYLPPPRPPGPSIVDFSDETSSRGFSLSLLPGEVAPRVSPLPRPRLLSSPTDTSKPPRSQSPSMPSVSSGSLQPQPSVRPARVPLTETLAEVSGPPVRRVPWAAWVSGVVAGGLLLSVLFWAATSSQRGSLAVASALASSAPVATETSRPAPEPPPPAPSQATLPSATLPASSAPSSAAPAESTRQGSSRDSKRPSRPEAPAGQRDLGNSRF